MTIINKMEEILEKTAELRKFMIDAHMEVPLEVDFIESGFVVEIQRV